MSRAQRFVRSTDDVQVTPQLLLKQGSRSSAYLLHNDDDDDDDHQQHHLLVHEAGPSVGVELSAMEELTGSENARSNLLHSEGNRIPSGLALKDERSTANAWECLRDAPFAPLQIHLDPSEASPGELPTSSSSSIISILASLSRFPLWASLLLLLACFHASEWLLWQIHLALWMSENNVAPMFLWCIQQLGVALASWFIVSSVHHYQQQAYYYHKSFRLEDIIGNLRPSMSSAQRRLRALFVAVTILHGILRGWAPDIAAKEGIQSNANSLLFSGFFSSVLPSKNFSPPLSSLPGFSSSLLLLPLLAWQLANSLTVMVTKPLHFVVGNGLHSLHAMATAIAWMLLTNQDDGHRMTPFTFVTQTTPIVVAIGLPTSFFLENVAWGGLEVFKSYRTLALIVMSVFVAFVNSMSALWILRFLSPLTVDTLRHMEVGQTTLLASCVGKVTLSTTKVLGLLLSICCGGFYLLEVMGVAVFLP